MPELEIERFHVIALRCSEEQLRGARVTSESIAPALCMIVADVLERVQRGRTN